MRNKVDEFIKLIGYYYNMLPKEVKVAMYIALSFGLADVIKQIGLIEVNNTWLAIIINILLVFLKQLQPRLETYKNR